MKPEAPAKESRYFGAGAWDQMNIQQLIEIDRAHEEVTVEGTIQVSHESRLTANADDSNAPVVLLPHDHVAHALENGVPIYGGGPFSYHDRAAVTGSVAKDPWRFVTVSRIVIFRDVTWTVEPGKAVSKDA